MAGIIAGRSDRSAWGMAPPVRSLLALAVSRRGILHATASARVGGGRELPGLRTEPRDGRGVAAPSTPIVSPIETP